MKSKKELRTMKRVNWIENQEEHLNKMLQNCQMTDFGVK